MKVLLLFLLSIIYINSSAQNGTIRGKITDQETGEELVGSVVQIKEISGKAAGSDLDGNYSLSAEPGKYTVVVSYISYQTKTITGVEVKSGEVTVINVALGTEGTGLKDIVVEVKAIQSSETNILLMKKKSINMTDGISSETFRKTGDNDAAAAMKRVTGVSVQGGKYVFVRGLSDRYSKTILNGSEIPGLDPNRNTVQMDLFPATTIDNMVVYKTFTPDLPADWAGGLVNINTKDYPEKFSLQISNGITYNSQSSLKKDFLSYDGSSFDWAAAGAGSRHFPFINRRTMPDFGSSLVSDEDSDELYETTKKFNTIWEGSEKTSFMDHNHSVSFGNQIVDKDNLDLGYTFSATYRREYNHYTDGKVGDYFRAGPESGVLTALRFMDQTRSQMNVLYGGLFGLSAKIKSNHKISFNGIINRGGEKETQYLEGRKPDDDPNLFLQYRSLNYQERGLYSAQFKGEHLFFGTDKLKIDWIGSYTNSTLSSPDQRIFSNGYRISTSGDTVYSIEPSIGRIPTRFTWGMFEDNIDFKLNFIQPFVQWSELKGNIKFGTSATIKDRIFLEDRFAFDNNNSATGYKGSIDEYFADTNLLHYSETGSLEGVYARNDFQKRNNYNASSKFLAGYAMAELPINRRLKTIFGSRLETTKIDVYSLDPKLSNGGNINTYNILPSASSTYSLNEKINIRAAYSKTIARPSFREIAPFADDPVEGNPKVGNDTLQITKIDNYDLRFEFFPRPSELISFGVFYKNFIDPIELVSNISSPHRELTWRNLKGGYLYGAELEIRKSLDFLADTLKNFTFVTNLTYIYSRVKIDAQELLIIKYFQPDAPNTRQMYGQSPYIINFGLSYINIEKTWESNLVFNLQGPRISLVNFNAPNIIEYPLPLLDFNIKRKINEKWALRLSMGNILNQRTRQLYNYNDLTYYFRGNYREGRTVGLTLTYQI